MSDPAGKNFIDLTANIVSAYLSNNPTPASEIPALISQIHAALLRVSTGRVDAPLEPAKPAVSVKKSMTPDYLVCLEDGKRFKSLKRHLRSQYNMTPEQYRDKWGLPPDNPMVAPNYAVARSALAKKMWTRPAAAAAEITRPARRSSGGRGKRLACIGANALDHRTQAVGALRCQMLAESEFVEYRDGVGRENLLRRVPEYSVSRIAISPRTMCASLSPR